MPPVTPIHKTKRAKIEAAGRAVGNDSAPGFAPLVWLRRHWQTVAGCVALFAAVLIFYSSVRHNGFVPYDDPGYIRENKHVMEGLTWRTVKWAFLTNTEANWHPLTWLSHAADVDVFGLNPAGPHWENVALHGLNAVLLFLLLQYATGFRWRSLMVAALFALHPINVESVAWAAERKNVLSTLFFMLALWAYVWYTRKPARGRYAAVVGLYFVALLAKPQVITFPFLLLLFDYWPLKRFELVDLFGGGRGEINRTEEKKSGAKARKQKSKSRAGALVGEKVPLFVMTAASAVVTVLAQKSGGAVKDLAYVGVGLRFETAAISYLRYLGKLFWPVKLVAIYPHPLQLYPAWEIAAAVGVLLGITAMVCGRLRQQGYLAVGWFWFLGSLVPMIGLVQVGEQALADRYAYISFIGLFFATVWLIADAVEALKISGRWLAAPAVVCLLALGVLTYRQVRYWHDAEGFWRGTLAATQNNYIANRDLASLLHEHGRDAEAIPYLREALAINPHDLLSNMYMGAHEEAQGNLPAALDRFQFVALHADHPRLRAQAYSELGSAYRRMGDVAKAKECYETSLQLVHGQPELMVTLGVMVQKSGDLAEALRQYERADALQHTDVQELLVAQALQLEGRTEQANAVYKRVAQRSPDLAQAQKTVETILHGR